MSLKKSAAAQEAGGECGQAGGYPVARGKRARESSRRASGGLARAVWGGRSPLAVPLNSLHNAPYVQAPSLASRRAMVVAWCWLDGSCGRERVARAAGGCQLNQAYIPAFCSVLQRRAPPCPAWAAKAGERVALAKLPKLFFSLFARLCGCPTGLRA